MTPPILRVVARALQLQRELVATRELAAHYAAEVDAAERMLCEERAMLARELAHHAETLRELIEARKAGAELDKALRFARTLLACEQAGHAAALNRIDALRVELDALRATPRPRAHMDWEGES